MIVLSAKMRDGILSSSLVDRIFQHESVDSTVAEAKRLIDEDETLARRALILADSCRAAPSRGLYFSLIIPKEIDESFRDISLLAIAETMENFFRRETKMDRSGHVQIAGKAVAHIDLTQYRDLSILSFSIDGKKIAPESHESTIFPKWGGRLLNNIMYQLTSYYISYTSGGFIPLKRRFEKRLRAENGEALVRAKKGNAS